VTVALRTLHRFSACVLAAFLLPHLVNHLVSLHGIAMHLAWMEALRAVYRQPGVEALLLGCAAFQAGSGLRLVMRGWKGRVGRVAWLQAASGLYLAFFLLVHVGAVLLGRAVFGLDTNFYFAAAGFHVPPWQWFFAPYYSLAVAALFAHLGCALYWRSSATHPARARSVLAGALVLGVVCAASITLALAGVFEPLEVPAEYLAPYQLR
jgi:succinate dehydrogenase/fumarate reductase cytochrome b subunit